MVYEFEISPSDCGLMIGLNGKNVKSLLARTGAKVIIKKHPCNTEKKICSVTGYESQIQNALRLIRKKFPESEFPHMTLEQVHYDYPVSCSSLPIWLSLPADAAFNAQICCTITPGHFFVHQPSHPTYYAMFDMIASMKATYSSQISPLLKDHKPGFICVARVLENDWYRAEIIEVHHDRQECMLKFLDFGGYATVPMLNIHQLRYEYSTMPFQAIECCLDNVGPIDGESWSEVAKLFFHSLVQNQGLQATVRKYLGNIPCLNLYRNNGGSNIFINQHLVNHGFAKVLTEDPTSEGNAQL